MKKIFLGLFSAIIFMSCGNENQNVSKEIISSDSTKKADSARVFVLPAPLQVATWLHQYGNSPELNLLSPADRSASQYKTDASRALNLGMLLTDLGYAGMYNQRQICLKYLSIIKQLSKDLQIENATSPTYFTRLENNYQQPDSLSKLILTIYDEANKQLNESHREKTAFFITSGSFIEGLSIFLSSTKTDKISDFPKLLGQQKLMLDNLATPLTFIAPDDETQDLYNTFFTLQHYYEPISVSVKNNIPVPNYSDDQLIPLRKKIVQLRDEIVKK